MRVPVKMLAFFETSSMKTRMVDIGDVPSDITENEILNKVFHWGQNDFQPQEFPSVSVGDVIQLAGKNFRVAMCGFEELNGSEYQNYLRIRACERYFWGLKRD